jgi:hypothetical protein
MALIDNKEMKAATAVGGAFGPAVRQVAGARISHSICSSLPAGKSGQAVGMIAQYRDHVALSIQVSMVKYQWLVIPNADVLEWGVLDKGSIPSRLGGDHSGAIAGALLFGPIGAFFGAASDKAAAAKDNAKPVIGITFRDADAEGAIFLEFPLGVQFRNAHDLLAEALPAQQRE